MAIQYSKDKDFCPNYVQEVDHSRLLRKVGLNSHFFRQVCKD
jgi:hypothetical protein